MEVINFKFKESMLMFHKPQFLFQAATLFPFPIDSLATMTLHLVLR